MSLCCSCCLTAGSLRACCLAVVSRLCSCNLLSGSRRASRWASVSHCRLFSVTSSLLRSVCSFCGGSCKTDDASWHHRRCASSCCWRFAGSFHCICLRLFAWEAQNAEECFCLGIFHTFKLFTQIWIMWCRQKKTAIKGVYKRFHIEKKFSQPLVLNHWTLHPTLNSQVRYPSS